MPLKNPYVRTDESFFRSVYLGLLYELTESIWIPGYEKTQIDSVDPTTEDLEREYNEFNRVYVPMFLNLGFTEERFFQDHFIHNQNELESRLIMTKECKERFAEGAYDRVPRGQITPGNIDVDSGANTNPYARGVFHVYNPKTCEYEMMNSKIRNVMVKLPCTASIYVANHNDGWYIVENLIKLYIKLRKFNYTWKGVRGEGQFKLATSYEVNRLFEFTYPETNKILVNFSLDVTAIMPIFDPYKQFNTSNVIDNYATTLNIDEMPPERVPTNPNLEGPRRNPFLH